MAELHAEWLSVRGPHSSAHHLRSIKTFGKLHMLPLAGLRIDQISTDVVERTRAAFLSTHSRASANH